MQHLFIIMKLFLVISFFAVNCAAIEFNRTNVGVTFSAYVKRSERNSVSGKDEIPGWKSYQLQDIVTMVKVINTRFSWISTYGAGVDNVAYTKNTSKDGVNAISYAAEAAAILNQDQNATVLELFQGIWVADRLESTNTEVRVAFDLIDEANTIHPGTVSGIVFSQRDIGKDLQRTKRTLGFIRKYKAEAYQRGLQTGTRQTCHEISAELTAILEDILKQVNFIICQVNPSYNESSVAKSFESVKIELLRFRSKFSKINPTVEMIGQTKWSDEGDDPVKATKNLREYWKLVNEFSEETDIKIFLHSAFDEPWMKVISKGRSRQGWWRLRSNKDVGVMDGYVEKVFAPTEEEVADDATALMQEPTTSWIAIGIVIAVVVIISLLVVLFVYVRMKRLRQRVSQAELDEFFIGVEKQCLDEVHTSTTADSLFQPYDTSLEISHGDLRIDKHKLLGKGEFGRVYQGKLNGISVAVKVASANCPLAALRGLLSEIKILTYLGKHENICCILGAYTENLARGSMNVITELCGSGSLQFYIRNHPFENDGGTYQNVECITIQQLIQWSAEICSGMEFLESKQVVHCDLATRNVLLCENKTAKISDFGLSRRLYDYTNYVKKNQEPLPWRWMSIESLRKLEFTSKTDVWSFGVTLWEIFSLGDIPYPGLSWNLDFVDKLANGMRMAKPKQASDTMYQIMLDCWNSDPLKRPTFHEIKSLLGRADTFYVELINDEL